jgi:Uma2 family endonuclease
MPESPKLRKVQPAPLCLAAAIDEWYSAQVINSQTQSELVPAALERTPLVLHVRNAVNLTSQEFFALCAANRDLRIERSAQGDILIMPPTGGRTGVRSGELFLQLRLWADQDGSGVVFDSSTGFELPSGAIRSPDVAWVRRARLETLTIEQKETFLQLCPDFVIELRSPSDRMAILQEQMIEYMSNGAQLAWLIDPIARRVLRYRPNVGPEAVQDPSALRGDPVLPGFVLTLRAIWEPTI